MFLIQEEPLPRLPPLSQSILTGVFSFGCFENAGPTGFAARGFHIFLPSAEWKILGSLVLIRSGHYIELQNEFLESALFLQRTGEGQWRAPVLMISAFQL